jgi:hypothetical protein
LFSVVFAHPPSLHSSVSLLSVISLLLTNTESRTGEASWEPKERRAWAS